MYAITIFLSSFLLFQVQPLVGKYILPWFGGTPSVWSVCLLFFQLMLLMGYAYAHLIARRLGTRPQTLLHMAMLAASLLLLPITPSEAWNSTSLSNPTWQILGLLIASVGAQFFLLSATAPLLQSWYLRNYPGKSPFRLYALSNAGSLLALFTFPFVFEYWFRLHTQMILWSTTYAAFAIMCGLSAWQLFRRNQSLESLSAPKDIMVQTTHFAENQSAEINHTDVLPPSLMDILLWLGLAAFGSVMLLATTNQMCRDVAAVPFLWVLPLGIYLLTFIICFDRESWYQRNRSSVMLIVGVFMACAVLYKTWIFPLTWQVVIYSFTLLVCCMSCHGELVKLKPHPRYLTLFYLTISAGGALGGIFVTLVAPVIFDMYMEYEIGLAGCCLMILLICQHERLQRKSSDQIRIERFRIAMTRLAVCVSCIMLVWLANTFKTTHNGKIVASRNFYGALQLAFEDSHDPEFQRLKMSHGSTIHGFQYQAVKKRHEPTLYYVKESGIGLALEHHPRRIEGENLRIGVVGLGTGTLASYGTSGDYICFYEINPLVIEMADKHFTFIKDAIARGVEVEDYLGDARIVMERQVEQANRQRFDVLAVDAFTSDAIPVHLLTKECFDLYWKHLKHDGILAVHVSNRYLDLSPVIRKIAELFGKEAYGVYYQPTKDKDRPEKAFSPSEWILVTDNNDFLSHKTVKTALKPWPVDAPQPLLWTDDFSNIYSVLR